MLRRRRPPRDLDRVADGHVWRLTRGRDFEGPLRDFRTELELRAEAEGRVVRTLPDRIDSDKHLWVQYGSGYVGPGGSCPSCGGTRIRRVHHDWARCVDCDAQLLYDESLAPAEIGAGPADEVTAASEAATGAASPRRPGKVKAEKSLDALTGVSLVRHSLTDDAEQCFGEALSADGARLLLSVIFPLEDGRRIPDPVRHGRWRYDWYIAPVRYFGTVLDADGFSGEPVDWRIAMDPGPDPSAAG